MKPEKAVIRETCRIAVGVAADECWRGSREDCRDLVVKAVQRRGELVPVGGVHAAVEDVGDAYRRKRVAVGIVLEKIRINGGVVKNADSAQIRSAAVAAGGWYFHAHGYTPQKWAQRYLSFLPFFQTADSPEGVFSEPETEGIVFETLPGGH